MRALIFLVLLFVFVYLRLGSYLYLYLSSKQTVNAHAPRWLMAFICHSDRATLISTAAARAHLQTRLRPSPPTAQSSSQRGVTVVQRVCVCVGVGSWSGLGARGQAFQGFVWLRLFAGQSVCLAIHDPRSGASGPSGNDGVTNWLSSRNSSIALLLHLICNYNIYLFIFELLIQI